MKVLKIDSKCDGCGLCVVNCKYLKENDEGIAEYIVGSIIDAKDIPSIEKTVSECPQGAIQLVDEGFTNKSGVEGAKETLAKLKKELNKISVKKQVSLKFDAKEIQISVPYSSNERWKKFSSESEARYAAKNEFSRLCYSESAYRPILKRIFVEYKVNVLKPYYDSSNQEGNVYYTYNQKVRELLAKAYAEINPLVGGKIPEYWKNFSVYLQRGTFVLEPLLNFEERSTSSGIISELKSLSYSSLDDYVSYMDFDYDERYVGEGFFGAKYKEEWYFTDFNEAAKTFINDLKWAVNYKASDIQQDAEHLVKDALKFFEDKLKKVINRKISELEKIIMAEQ